MKKEIEQEITQRFIDALAEGTIPWRKGWTTAGIMPHNYYSRRPYRGINTLILGLVAAERGYSAPAWTTYKKAAENGAQVRKGEKSTRVVFWRMWEVEDKDSGKMKTVPLPRMYSVFNVDQIDGIEWEPPNMEPVPVRDAIKQIVSNYPNPPSITHTFSEKAYYMPSSDSIVLPLLEQFDDEQRYAETLFHECVHSTGHTSRLSRFEDSVSCRGEYAKEELVAEIGAAMLMQIAGVTPDIPVMANYVQGWMQSLTDDSSLIIKAAQAAQRATDHILGTISKETDNETN